MVRQPEFWRRLFGLEQTVVEGVDLDDASGALVIRVRPNSRALDVGEMMTYLPAAKRTSSLKYASEGGSVRHRG